MIYKITTRADGTKIKTPVVHLQEFFEDTLSELPKQERKTKVLIVDDEPHIVKLIKMTLDPARYDIYEAYSGAEALEKAKTVYPDLITLDIMMPNMSGYDVCKMLKKNPLTSYIPIVMLSAKTELKDKMASILSGADDYLTKPFDPEELVNKINVNLD